MAELPSQAEPKRPSISSWNLMYSVAESNPDLGFASIMALSTLSAIIPIVFILAFSGMGFGLDVVVLTQEYHDEVTLVIKAVLGFGGFMYLFDGQYWPILPQVLCWTMIFAAMCISFCILIAEVPYGPICVFTVLTPLSIFGIKNVCFSGVKPHILVGCYYKVYISLAGIILISFFYWCTVNGNMWESTTNAQYSHKAGCKVNFKDLEECKGYSEGVPCFIDPNSAAITFSQQCTSHCLDVYAECEEAFIIWSFPGLAAMALVVMGFISKLLERPSDPHNNETVGVIAKACAIFLFLFWILASLAGAGEGLSSSLIAFGISMFIGSAIVFSVVFWNYLMGQSSVEIVDKVKKQIDSYIDVLRGLLVLAFSPLSLVFLLLSVINQCIRRYITRHCCRKRVPDAEFEHKGIFTLGVARQINYVLSWDQVQVLTYAVYWGVGYIFLNVLASKFTTVFLSWLIEYTADMNIFAVTGIVIGVGMALFMLPPIPGLPIYLTSGIVLVSVGRNTLTLWGSIGYASAVSTLLKLLACSVQQQLIGANLGGSVAVKQMVSINSEGMRAMRVILSDKGFSSRKIFVLVGGPDWPVSVLCGILGLDLLPILVGTLPVVILVVPTVLCGSFAYMGSLEGDNGLDKYPWADTMGAVASAVTAGAMFYFMLAAAAAVKSTLENEKDIIDAIPLDEDVKEADAVSAEKSDAYRRVTIWSNVPFGMKCIIILSVTMMIGCCYLLAGFNSLCFEEYDLMYTIREHLGGNWTNIILLHGRIALLLFTISYVLLFTFQTWASKKANELILNLRSEGLSPLNANEVNSYAAA